MFDFSEETVDGTLKKAEAVGEVEFFGVLADGCAGGEIFFNENDVFRSGAARNRFKTQSPAAGVGVENPNILRKNVGGKTYNRVK